MSKYKASIGSVSTGTLRPIDLLEAFADELERIDKDEHEHLINLARVDIDRLNKKNETVDEMAMDTLESLVLQLEMLAPPYCYFGAHPGDGADFGFWPDQYAIVELPQGKQSDEDYVEINDHGNVTIFSADGTVLLEIV